MTKEILIVDDSASCLELVKSLITSHFEFALKLTTCTNGVEAKQTLAQNSFDLVITDIVMPEMDGYELIRYIRSNQHVPIVALSAGNGKLDTELTLNVAQAIGANAVVSKLQLDTDLIKTVQPFLI
ncbi:response regulator [Vibrio marisflavi]|nr:response regulator [Vibrio marisflavi]